jgi:acyl-coenzyme A thioesterase PaaI-like protein
VSDESAETSEREQLLVAPLVLTDPHEAVSRTWTGTPVPPGYTDMIDELRELLDRVAAAAPDSELVADTTKAVAELNTRLREVAAEEPNQLAGRILTAPGRAQLAVPPLHLDDVDDAHASGHVRFGAHFMGSNDVVHGGAIPMLFDDLLGRLSVVGGRPRSRTAYLHVDYRSVAMIDTELRVEAWLERVEGRKRFLRGTLHDGDTLCAEATGLFVELKPGHP